MKLFLSSHDLGNFAEDLRELVGENRKTLLITNARDHKDPDVRIQSVAQKLEIFRQAGFQTEELDLREYFSKDPDQTQHLIYSCSLDDTPVKPWGRRFRDADELSEGDVVI